MGSTKKILLADTFFQELLAGRLTSADRVLQRINETTHTLEWQKGYINALEGMLLASSSKDERIIFTSQGREKQTSKLIKVFSQQSKNKMLGEFDRGFFSAWIDYSHIQFSSENSTGAL